MRDSEKDSRLSTSFLSYAATGTAMLSLLYAKAAENGFTLSNTIPAILCLICIWALYFNAKSAMRESKSD